MADKKIKLKAGQLLEPVAFLKPFIADVAPVSALTKMAWAGRVMYGQDGIIGAAVSSPLVAPRAGVVIEGKRMLDFLVALKPDTEITAHFTDKSLVLSGGRSKAVLRFATAENAKYPKPAIPPKSSDFKEGAGSLMKAMKAVEFCIDGKSGPFSAVCLEGMFAWSSDGSRAARALLDKKLNFKEQLLIPHRAIKTFAGTEDPTHWARTENLFWFIWKDRRIWTRLVEPKFPELSTIFKKAREHALKAPGFDHDCIELANAVHVAASSGGFGVVGELDGKMLTLRGEGDLSEMKITADVPKSRGKATFFVKPDYLHAALSRFPKVMVTGQGALYFLNQDQGTEHVVMELVKEIPREHEQEVPF